MSSNKAFKNLARLGFLGALSAGIISAIDLKWLEVTEINVNLNTDRKLKIAHITDLHEFEYGKDNADLIKIIKEQAPDLICITGDLVIARYKAYANSLKFLEELVKLNIPVVYSMGNHEVNFGLTTPSIFDPYLEKVKELGVLVLDDANISFDGFKIYGYTNKMCQYPKFKKPYRLKTEEITEAVGAKPEEPVIMLAHNPIYFKEYADWGADLVLSGHLHGGIVRIPGVGGLLSPQTFFSTGYTAGLYKEKGSLMYVSRGLGVHSLPLRVFNRPEIAFININ